MDKISSPRRPVGRTLKSLLVVALLFAIFFVGVGVGGASKSDVATANTTPATTSSQETVANTSTQQCTILGEVSYMGICQPVVKNMSCNFIQGSSSYTCELNLYNTSKLLNCATSGTTYAYCY